MEGDRASARRSRSRAWNDYVPKHLLPRLHGYELMMAPYAIAHMKIGLKLARDRLPLRQRGTRAHLPDQRP